LLFDPKGKLIESCVSHIYISQIIIIIWEQQTHPSPSGIIGILVPMVSPLTWLAEDGALLTITWVWMGRFLG